MVLSIRALATANATFPLKLRPIHLRKSTSSLFLWSDIMYKKQTAETLTIVTYTFKQ